jgi:thymidylate synthase|tara:strand:+ start:121 stop:501 length:381 start_codon:yes stop_codon:yes gene_type:complete
MKVKIAKTIDMNQIPNEVRRMLDQIKNNLSYGLPEGMNRVTMYSLSSRGEEFFQAVEAIDSLRQDLAAFDESLQEVQNILTGYKEAVMPKAEEEEYDEEWLAQEEAETEKRQAYTYDADEVEDEEG